MLESIKNGAFAFGTVPIRTAHRSRSQHGFRKI